MQYPATKTTLQSALKWVAVVCLTVAGIGCGQKGALYLPADTESAEQQCPDKRCKATSPKQHQ